ncbi:hypothetical protein Bbelb_068700 [Branchiostoma belcheri]|nr:hypothetical protein Bbelb_068700 [Branchiostoma belcheri]
MTSGRSEVSLLEQQRSGFQLGRRRSTLTGEQAGRVGVLTSYCRSPPETFCVEQQAGRKPIHGWLLVVDGLRTLAAEARRDHVSWSISKQDPVAESTDCVLLLARKVIGAVESTQEQPHTPSNSCECVLWTASVFTSLSFTPTTTASHSFWKGRIRSSEVPQDSRQPVHKHLYALPITLGLQAGLYSLIGPQADQVAGLFLGPDPPLAFCHPSRRKG